MVKRLGGHVVDLSTHATLDGGDLHLHGDQRPAAIREPDAAPDGAGVLDRLEHRADGGELAVARPEDGIEMVGNRFDTLPEGGVEVLRRSRPVSMRSSMATPPFTRNRGSPSSA